MKVFTTHLRGDEPPVLVAEGFSVWGAFYGGLWLLVHAAWIPAMLCLAAYLLAVRASAVLGSPAPVLGLMLLQGLLARDLQRWGLARRGYRDGPVVAGADYDSALARLLDHHAGLQQNLAGATR